MRLWLLLLFLGVPLLELIVLIKLGQTFGFWTALGIVLGAGVAGAALARWQGVRVLLRIQDELHAGRVPAAEMLDGVLILFAAVLLLIPGFLSDVLGLLLLLPWVRYVVKNWLRLKLMRMMQSGRSRIFIRGGDYYSNGQ